MAQWLSIWPSGAGVSEEGPQPSPGGGPPRPGLHLSVSREDLTLRDLGPSKPKSERLSGGARPGLRARTTERLRPSQASMHTGRHRAHGGSGGSSGSHGRAGYKEEMSRSPGPDLAPGRREDQQAGCFSPPRLLGEAPLFGRPGPRAPSTRCRAARRGPPAGPGRTRRAGRRPDAHAHSSAGRRARPAPAPPRASEQGLPRRPCGMSPWPPRKQCCR